MPIEGLGDGFSWKSQDLEHSAQLARDGWRRPPSHHPGSGEHFLVVLDEITYPLIYGWLPLDDVLATLRERPRRARVPDRAGAARPNHRAGRHRDRDDDGQARLQGGHPGAARHRGLSRGLHPWPCAWRWRLTTVSASHLCAFTPWCGWATPWIGRANGWHRWPSALVLDKI
jgi:hypothetical protein